MRIAAPAVSTLAIKQSRRFTDNEASLIAIIISIDRRSRTDANPTCHRRETIE